MSSTSIRSVCRRLGVLAPLAGLFGCEPQVGEEYRGEPLFSLQGTVILSDPDDARDLVPGLLFGKVDETVDELILMDAEVQGEFPARFRMDVTKPPPADVLHSVYSEYSVGSFALARITVFPRSHPERVPRLAVSRTGPEVYPPEGEAYLAVESACAADGRCFERTLSCREEPCSEIIWQTEGFDAQNTVANLAEAACSGSYCLFAKGYCSSPTHCESAVLRCDQGTDRYSGVSTDGTVTSCEVVAESGDTEIERLERYEDVAQNYEVIYYTDPVTFFDGEHYEPGYHLLHYVEPDSEAFLDQFLCSDDAWKTAVFEYNLAHQTSFDAYRDYEAIYSVAPDVHTRWAELFLACPPVDATDVIEDPLAEPLTLVIGRDPVF